MKKRFCKPEDVGIRYGKSARTIRDWITRGCRCGASLVMLPAVKAGRGWLIEESDLEVFELRLKHATPRIEVD